MFVPRAKSHRPFSRENGPRKRDSNFPIFRPALFPRTNENPWPYSMINAATVCRFIQKCVYVRVADFDEFESKEGNTCTRCEPLKCY